jgi:putative polyhydroxyalkanoic acid system protein
MPKIEVNHAHSLEADAVKARMEAVQADLASRYGLKFDWRSDTELAVSGKGVKGTITLRPKEVAVKLDLSMLLSPMKGKIESKLRSKLAEELG